MVHVEQVLVHEREMSRDLAVQLAGLVGLVALGGEVGREPPFGQSRIPGKDEDQPVDLLAGIGLNGVDHTLLA